MTPEQTMLFKRLIEYAHRQAMMRNKQIAQDIRLVLNDAARYWHLRDKSDPDLCRYYLASDDPANKFNDPGHVDKQIDTDRANMEARERATKA
jgi:hypothetical protein